MTYLQVFFEELIESIHDSSIFQSKVEIEKLEQVESFLSGGKNSVLKNSWCYQKSINFSKENIEELNLLEKKHHLSFLKIPRTCMKLINNQHNDYMSAVAFRLFKCNFFELLLGCELAKCLSFPKRRMSAVS